ncbi:hypothetical protein ADT27_10175 [Xanthomonas oryzae]|nr:hypothetical protein ADT27_10175 [Xanthomonas oryzae]
MPSGLRCRDAQGRVVLDVVDRLPRILGSFVADSGQVYNIALPPAGSGTYFYSARPIEPEVRNLYGWSARRHQVSISGSTLTADKGTTKTLIIYGVF